MTAEAFGRLASWSSFNIVVGRHDEFAHSRVAIPQKRGTTAKSIVLHFPPSHTLKLETPERRHSCHTRHSHYPRGRGTPRKNRQNTRSVPHPLAQIHAIGRCRGTMHLPDGAGISQSAPPHYDTFRPPQWRTRRDARHNRTLVIHEIHHYEASQSNGMQYQAHTTTTGRTNIAFTSVRFGHYGHSRLCDNSSRDMATT